MSRCEVKACPYIPVNGEKFCLQHRPKPALLQADAAIQVVARDAVPATKRYSVDAENLLAAAKALDPGHALKVNLDKFPKSCVRKAQRYARAAGLRLGVRLIGLNAFLWKMTAEEIAAGQVKADRLAVSRAAKGKRTLPSVPAVKSKANGA